MTDHTIDESAATIGRASKITVALAGSLLAVALWGADKVNGIDTRQTRIEERAIAAQIAAAKAQETTNEKLGDVSDDIRELSSTMRAGLAIGTQERSSILSRVYQLEKDLAAVTIRVSNLEK